MKGVLKPGTLILLLLILYWVRVSSARNSIKPCDDKPGCICQEHKCPDNKIFHLCPRTCLNCEPCRDLLPSCRHREGAKRCGYGYVRKECRKLCGYCTRECIDQLDCYKCRKLVKLHSCKHSHYLRKNCRLTCKLCKPRCVDIYPLSTCVLAKRIGLCKTYAREFCLKSCGVCRESTRHSHRRCTNRWKKHCRFEKCASQNNDRSCRKTCGICGCGDKRSDCRHHLSQCLHEKWRDQCQGSCQICKCSDTIRNCHRQRHRCHDPKVRSNCLKTCRVCKPACKDFIEPHYCKLFHKRYGCRGRYMKSYCRLTCNICHPKCHDLLPGHVCQKFKHLRKCHDPYVLQVCQKTCRSSDYDYYGYYD